MNRETAIEFGKRVGNVFDRLSALDESLRSRLNEEDFHLFAEAMCEIVTELDLGIMEVIYRTFPDLRPEGMVPTNPLGSDCSIVRPKRDIDRAER